jgi:hypothetical protein
VGGLVCPLIVDGAIFDLGLHPCRVLPVGHVGARRAVVAQVVPEAKEFALSARDCGLRRGQKSGQRCGYQSRLQRRHRCRLRRGLR